MELAGFLGVTMLWVKAAHVIFVIFFMAGLFMMPRFFVYHHQCPVGSDEDRKWIEREDRLRKIILNPSILFVWIFGLMPALRASAPSAIVNVASTAGRVSRARTGAYSASKFALVGWTDSLYAEELPHGVHVGMVLPGFIATEGFPATELKEKALTRWLVSKPEAVAEAIYEAGPGGKPERYVPRYYAVAAVARILTPRLLRRVLTSGSAGALTTTTAND